MLNLAPKTAFLAKTTTAYISQNIEVMPERGQDFTMVKVFFSLNLFILIKATQGRYWNAMLGYVPVGGCIYRYREEIAEIGVFNIQN